MWKFICCRIGTKQIRYIYIYIYYIWVTAQCWRSTQTWRPSTLRCTQTWRPSTPSPAMHCACKHIPEWKHKYTKWSQRNHNYAFVLMCLYFTPDIYFRCCLSNFLFHSSIEMSVKWKSIEKWKLKHHTYAGKRNVTKWRPKIYQAKCPY